MIDATVEVRRSIRSSLRCSLRTVVGGEKPGVLHSQRRLLGVSQMPRPASYRRAGASSRQVTRRVIVAQFDTALIWVAEESASRRAKSSTVFVAAML